MKINFNLKINGIVINCLQLAGIAKHAILTCCTATNELLMNGWHRNERKGFGRTIKEAQKEDGVRAMKEIRIKPPIPARRILLPFPCTTTNKCN